MNFDQKELEYLGNGGCYYISILHACNVTDIVKALEIYRKAVKLNIMEKDCYIRNPELLIGMITGHTYRVTKTIERPNLDSKKDILIGEYFNPRTNFAHFCDVTTEVYDPLVDSVTVKEGYIRSYRHFKFIK